MCVGQKIYKRYTSVVLILILEEKIKAKIDKKEKMLYDLIKKVSKAPIV